MKEFPGIVSDRRWDMEAPLHSSNEAYWNTQDTPKFSESQKLKICHSVGKSVIPIPEGRKSH